VTAANHALTGALIGLCVGNPVLAPALAFLSHFVLDAIPHYDPPGNNAAVKIGSRRFFLEHIVLGGALCLLLVVLLAAARPAHWLQAVVCAFVATIPDLLFIPRYLHIKRTGKDNLASNWFWRFHNNIQWFQKPIGFVVEAAWFAAAGSLLLQLI